MLNSSVCFVFLSLLSLPIVIIFFIINRKSEKLILISKLLSLLFLIFGVILLINDIFFPLPIQKLYISELKTVHRVPNYLIPFERIAHEISRFKLSGQELTRYAFGNALIYIKLLLYYSLISFVLCLGFFRKKYVLNILGLVILIELLKLLANIIVGANYKSLSSDELILSFIGMFLGYVFFRKLYLATIKFKEESNILSIINKYFIVNSIFIKNQVNNLVSR